MTINEPVTGRDAEPPYTEINKQTVAKTVGLTTIYRGSLHVLSINKLDKFGDKNDKYPMAIWHSYGEKKHS